MYHAIARRYRLAYTGLSRPIWYLALIYFVNRVGAMVIPFLSIYLTTRQGFSLSDTGLVMSAFGLGAIAGNYAGGNLTDRFGPYWVQIVSLILAGVFWIWLGQVDSLYAMCGVIFVLSLIGDMFRPANKAAIVAYAQPEYLARSYGLIRLAVNLGYSAGPILGGLVIAGFGYEALFWIDGLTCILAAGFFLVLLPPATEVARQQPTAAERAEQARDRQAGGSAYRNGPFLLFCLFNFLSIICFMQFFSSLPVHLSVNLGYSEFQIGAFAAINGLLIVLLEMPLVSFMEERWRVLRVIFWGMVAVGSAFLLLPFGYLGTAVLVVFYVILTFGEMLSMPFANTYAAQLAPPARRGEYMGLIGISFSAGFIVAPTLGLRLAESIGFETLFAVVAVVGLAASLGVRSLDRRAARAVELEMLV
jgi:predicted MFS family arabinose efflux permease